MTDNAKELAKRMEKLQKEIETPKKPKGRPSTKSLMNPVLETFEITPEKERKEKVEMATQLATLAELSKKLTDARERLSVESRLRDVEYVKRLDAFIAVVLDALAEIQNRPALLKKVVREVIKNGQFTKLKDLMTTVGIAADKRNDLLAYDEARHPASKKKLKLSIVWKKDPETGIEQGGVQAEVNE